MNKQARVIAFYLPQFHPIPENDVWWGKGFTEWTNVGKAKSLFKGHRQPRVPADLGYYDLRLPEVRHTQEEMATYAGVEGFAYWHYWWAGERLLEKPYQAKLNDPHSTLPFCVAWANETWSGIWHGNPGKILKEQTYPGIEDHTKHFYTLLESFQDNRYITVDGKPLLYLYRPFDIPDFPKFSELWNNLAVKEGLNGIHFTGLSRSPGKEYSALRTLGLDSINPDRIGDARRQISGKYFNYLRQKTTEKIGGVMLNKYRYEDIIKHLSSEDDISSDIFPTILPQWDNSPRSERRAMIFTGSTPELFEQHLREILGSLEKCSSKKKIFFLKSWNEWAEGNYVEPDLDHGWGYLDVLRKVILGVNVQCSGS